MQKMSSRDSQIFHRFFTDSASQDSQIFHRFFTDSASQDSQIFHRFFTDVGGHDFGIHSFFTDFSQIPVAVDSLFLHRNNSWNPGQRLPAIRVISLGYRRVQYRCNSTILP